jgi:hypothetical protein
VLLGVCINRRTSCGRREAMHVFMDVIICPPGGAAAIVVFGMAPAPGHPASLAVQAALEVFAIAILSRSSRNNDARTLTAAGSDHFPCWSC